jgi:hypothetical protein
MNHWGILFLFALFPNFGNALKIGEEKMSVRRFKEIASYVGDLISDYNGKNPDKTSDVAIMTFQNYPDSFFLEALIDKIPKQNLVLMPKMQEKVEHQHIRTVAFIIILADNFEAVSGKRGILIEGTRLNFKSLFIIVMQLTNCRLECD